MLEKNFPKTEKGNVIFWPYADLWENMVHYERIFYHHYADLKKD